MATLVIMPRQGQSVESCVITEWKKKKGDAVAEGDVLFSYETDKSSFDEPATVSGTLLEVFAEDGDDVPCLEAVCIIGNPGEDISALIPKKEEEAAPAAEEKAVEEVKEEKKEEVVVATESADKDGMMKISPRAKNLANKTYADLSQATPTGPNGRIIERDVNRLLDNGQRLTPEQYENFLKTGVAPAAAVTEAPAAAAAVAAPVAEYEDVKLSNVRKVIAKSMHESLSSMAQLTLNASFDATQMMAYRASLKKNAEAMGLGNITFNDMVLFAVAKTLKNHKDCNAHFLGDKMRFFNNVNLGIAVDTERGLLVPTVFNADKMSLNELSANAKTVIKAAQGGSISPDLLSGGTFTVTNLGAMGVESFTPVINPPQTCILGVCNITRRVKQVNGQDVFYDAMGLSLTFDHRALDGAPAARFLKELCTNLENFNLLMAK
ncbi:MAG: 2-oxo acid dehydrogenase subunit E2 [Clostridia bacterium]|nr:2-oxo acid dehydrogenase subunit E2 [Clostridia bacterium]MBQ7968382.1 2-oxo acid dehydrogenase subunit E2 [Clostridia bacterium]